MFQSAQVIRPGWRFTFQQDDGHKHTAKTTQEWLRDNSVNVLELPHLWRDLKMAVHRQPPLNLTELERICRDEWQTIPKYRRAKLVASYPTRLKAVITAKISKILFSLCHYGVLIVDWWGKNLSNFSKRLHHNVKKSRCLNTFWMHCITKSCYNIGCYT